MPAPQLTAVAGGSGALRSTLLLLGVFAFATGIASGIVRTAELVGQDFVLTPMIPHREGGGRVAGATTEASGPVAFAIDDGTQVQLYSVDVPGTTSVYNLLRLVQRSTPVRLDMVQGATADVVIDAVNERRPAAGERWVVDVDGAQSVAVDTTSVNAGATVTLRLTR